MWLFCLIILLSCRGVCQCHVTRYEDGLCKGIYCGIIDVSMYAEVLFEMCAVRKTARPCKPNWQKYTINWCILLVHRNFLYINWNNIAEVRANGDILMVNMVRTRECVRITRCIVTDCCSHYISLHNTNTCMHSRLWNSPVYLLHSECALMYGVYYFLWCHLI